MVCGADDVIALAVFYGIKELCKYGIKRGVNWYVDQRVVQSLEAVYDGAKGQFDRRRKPWCTIRRVITAYKTGNMDKFSELKQALKDAKDELHDLTEDARENISEEVADAALEAADAMGAMFDAMG